MPLRLGHLSAWIEVDGQEIPQYEPTYSISTNEYDGKQAECWIPSKEGKAFSVCWKNTNRTSPTGTYLIVDGIRVKGTHIHSATKRSGTGPGIDTQTQAGVQINPSKEKPFLFARQDDHHSEGHRRSAIGLGEIRVVVLELKEVQEPKIRVRSSALRDKSQDSETTLHGVGFGESRDLHPGPYQYRRRFHNVREIATFTFLYRPMSVLEANHIVPAPPYIRPLPIPPVTPIIGTPTREVPPSKSGENRHVHFQTPARGLRYS